MQTAAETYSALYTLQDKVLRFLTGHFGAFYVTGGVALSRFYLNHRFASDLDITVNLRSCFLKKASTVLELLKTQFLVPDDHVDVFQRNIQLFISGRDQLKISLSNNIYRQWSLPVMAAEVPVDNMKNMLAKKLHTLLGRDDPKDLFDIVSIASAYSFQWGEILRQAQKKAMMAQANDLLQFCRITVRFTSLLGGREPRDLLSLLGAPSPIHFDRTYLSAHIERNGIHTGKPSATIEFQSENLRRTAFKLKALTEQDVLADDLEIHGIPSSFNIQLGGASVSIVLKPFSAGEKAVKQFGKVSAEVYRDVEWMNGPLQAEELDTKFERIRNDLFLAGENTLGRGKLPIEYARPGIL